MDSQTPFQLENFQDAAAGMARGGLRPSALAQVKRFIESQLHVRPKVADMAREACLSPFHFARMFKQSTGKTPHAYLNERRIETARALLVQTGLTMREVSRRSGFATHAHFCSVFRRHTGETPAAYRGRSGEHLLSLLALPRHFQPATSPVQPDAR